MKKLQAIGEALLLPVFALIYLIVKNIVDSKGGASTNIRYMIKQTCIALFVLMVYANIGFVVYHITDWTLSAIAQGVSYVLGMWDLPDWQLSHQWIAGLAVAIITTGYVVQKTIRKFIVSVPEYAGALTVNYFGGRFAKHGQGLHLRFPWERLDPKLCFSMELVTVSFQEDYVTKDGGVAIVKGAFRYSPSFERLEIYAGVDEQTIGEALINIAKSDLTVEISSRTAQEAREQTATIKNSIEKKYDGVHPIEESLGFDLDDFTLVDIGFDTETQKALTASFAAKTMFAPGDDAAKREDILVLAGKAEKKVTQFRLDGEVRGLEQIGPAIVALLSSFFRNDGGKKNPKQAPA